MTRLPVIVAIPARNEADRIGGCLAALAAQPAARSRIAAVTVFANNCTDLTAAVARAQSLPFALHVVEAALPPGIAHIGHARRGATDAASALRSRLGLDDAIIAGTDADSRVAPGWLAALGAAFAADVDAVCGEIDLDRPLGPTLAEARAAEAEHADATARANALLDGQAHDPWPNHIWSWGANFAVRDSVLARVGGSPLVDLAEDRALHALLLQHDVRIRHARAVRVETSARADGRAPGGFADLLSDYASDPAALADFALEPAAISWQRAEARGAARRQWGDSPGFGAFWAATEARVPSLVRQRVKVADLRRETLQLESWITAAARRSGNQVAAIAPERAPRAASLR